MVFTIIVNAAIEKLLTFSEDTQRDSSPPLPQGVTFHTMQDASTTGEMEDMGSHANQYQWMDFLPSVSSSINEAPVINSSSHWVHSYPYPLYGPTQSVAIGNKSQVMPSSSTSGNANVAMATPAATGGVRKQLPWQQQMTATTHYTHQQHHG